MAAMHHDDTADLKLFGSKLKDILEVKYFVFIERHSGINGHLFLCRASKFWHLYYVDWGASEEQLKLAACAKT